MARLLPPARLLGRFPGLGRLDGLVRFVGTAADLHAHAPHDDILLQHAERVVPAPVDHQAGGETAEHEGEDDRHQGEDLLLRSEEHTSELQSLMRISYAVFCLKKKKL